MAFPENFYSPFVEDSGIYVVWESKAFSGKAQFFFPASYSIHRVLYNVVIPSVTKENSLSSSETRWDYCHKITKRKETSHDLQPKKLHLKIKFLVLLDVYD